ncbi:MAG: hypothetical protein KKB30_08405 [Proteobacteria bacterium]|nr:hypothetical protein [Pseudomonadota bacterium]MBU1714693.1 hypothetical protein [Pseudomonadota bacterium]
MKLTKTQKILSTLMGVLVAVLLFLSPGLRLPVLDNTTDDYFSEAITRAGVTYATCRVINASVSIVKDSSLNLEPAGVGVTLAVGQALDPIDDMIERVSDVLVTAITSLGVQKLAFEIGVSILPRILAVVLLIFSILIWCENENLAKTRKTFSRFILFILVARFALPISALANNYIQDQFFADKIAKANQELALGAAELEMFTKFTLPEIDGILGTIKNNAAFMQRKSIEFKNAIVATVNNAGSIVDNLLKLAFLYVGVFLIQVIALPIMVFFLLIKFANSLFESNLSYLK